MYNTILDYNKKTEGNSFSFYSYEIPVELLNSIRRILMTDYETYAICIENIEIIRNTGIINDDILKHRISQIPIDCDSEILLELNMKNFYDLVNVLSSDFKNYYNYEYYLNPDIIITQLKKEEELFIKIKTDKKSGKDSIQYRPTNIIVNKKMKILRHNITNKKLIARIFNFMEEKYDMKKENILNDKNIIGVLDTAKTNLDYVNIIKKELKIKKAELILEDYVIDNKHVRYFMIESDYKNPKELFISALDMLLKRVLRVKEIKELKENINTKYYFNIPNECATTCNVIQHYMNKLENVEFCYFNKKFPLDKDTELQIFLYNNNEEINQVIKNGIELFSTEIEKIKTLL